MLLLITYPELCLVAVAERPGQYELSCWGHDVEVTPGFRLCVRVDGVCDRALEKASDNRGPWEHIAR